MSDPRNLPALKPGDRVECLIGQKWRVCVVTGEPIAWSSGWRLDVRREGRDPRGRLFPLVTRWHTDLGKSVRLAPHLPPVTSNIFADFLDDHGHHDAARCLRAAFPLATAEDSP